MIGVVGVGVAVLAWCGDVQERESSAAGKPVPAGPMPAGPSSAGSPFAGSPSAGSPFAGSPSAGPASAGRSSAGPSPVVSAHVKESEGAGNETEEKEEGGEGNAAGRPAPRPSVESENGSGGECKWVAEWQTVGVYESPATTSEKLFTLHADDDFPGDCSVVAGAGGEEFVEMRTPEAADGSAWVRRQAVLLR
ncbi:hypothetical protein [Actinoplanes sp. NPDC023714]|uniref:hypothetical protein n=1 Tax=Actinoplanes sp. NPDC023714 TaxID=3154322 RepID=UPI003401D7F9